MWQYRNSDELYHFGIPGMKWGHRKAVTTNSQYSKISRKDYNKEYRSTYQKYIKNDPRTKQANKLAKQAISYGKKNKLNMDDGGGGSKKAGQKYMNMWEKHETLTDKIQTDSSKRAYNELKNKYGEKRIKQIGRENTALAIGTLAGVTVGTVGAVKLTKKGLKAGSRAIVKGGKYIVNNLVK